jgi:hypothetical protein
LLGVSGQRDHVRTLPLEHGAHRVVGLDDGDPGTVGQQEPGPQSGAGRDFEDPEAGHVAEPFGRTRRRPRPKGVVLFGDGAESQSPTVAVHG